MVFCFESYESLRFLGNDGANEGQNDEKMMTKMMKNDDQNDEKMKIPRGIPKNSGRGLWPKKPTRNLHFFFIFSSFLWFLLRILGISEIPKK